MRIFSICIGRKQNTSRYGLMVGLLLGFDILSAQDLDDGHLYVRILRGGMYPSVAAAGETVEYRVDYEWLRSDAQHLELSREVDWSPLVVQSFRYLTNAQGTLSFRVVLRIPESLVNTNGSDKWLFFTPQLRVLDMQGNGHRPYYTPEGFLRVLVRHALSISTNGTTTPLSEPPGSWWILIKPSSVGSSTDWESPLRDGSRVFLPPGGELLLGGLDPRIVYSMVNLGGIFVVRTEGPFEIFPYDSPEMYLQEFRTRSIPFIKNLYSFTETSKLEWWKIGVRPHRGTLPGATGKVIVSYEQDDGVEVFRRELHLEVIQEPLQSLSEFSTNETLVVGPYWFTFNKPLNTTVFKSVNLGSWQVMPDGGYHVVLLANYVEDGHFYTNGIKSYALWQLDSTEPVTGSYCGSWDVCADSWMIERRILSGHYECNSTYSNGIFCAKWTYTPGTVIAGQPPAEGNWTNVGTMNVPWFDAVNRSIRGTTVAPVRLRVRFAPPAQLDYELLNKPHIKFWEIRDHGWTEGEPRNDPVNTYRDADIRDEFVNFLWLRVDLKSGRVNGALDLDGSSWGGDKVLWVDMPIGMQSDEDESDIHVDLVANPSALRIEHLENTNRPWVELILEASNKDEPWSRQPVLVEGPNGGLLVLEEPRLTDRYGHYIFRWQPPEPVWFENKPLPQRFWFTARLPGGHSAKAVVEITRQVLKGHVVRRHAGADSNDPDADGLSPIAGAQVSLRPDFDPEFTSQTDTEGRFSIAVPEPGTYTVYVRKSGNQPPMTVTHSAPVQISEGETELQITEPLYLASLSTLDKLQRVYLPSVSDFLQASSAEDWLQMSPPTNPSPIIDSFLQRLKTQTVTASYDEESLRRLNLAVWTAYEGTRAAQEIAEFAADQIWEGSFAALNRLLVKAIEQIELVQILKDRIQKQIQQLSAAGNDPVKLRQLNNQLALLEMAETKFIEVKRRINQAAYSLYSQVAVRLTKSGSETRHTKRLFLQLVKYWNDRLLEYAGDQVEDWLRQSQFGQITAQEASRRFRSVTDSLNQLEIDLRKSLRKYLALGFRYEVAKALLEAAEAASAGTFPQRPYSYAAAQRAVDMAIEQMQAEINRFRTYLGSDWGYVFWLDFVNGVINDWDGWAHTSLVALSGGTLAQGVAIADRILKAVEVLLPVVQVVNGIQAVQSLDEDGALTSATVQGIRFAFSRTGRFQVRVHSPVHLMAVDALGRRTGYDATGTFYLEIPGAFAQPATEHQPETLYLPDTAAAYRLVIQGTATGYYKVETVTELSDGQIQTNSVWSGQVNENTLRSVPLYVNGNEITTTGTEEPLPIAYRMEIRDESGSPISRLNLASGSRLRVRPVLVGTDQLALPTAPTNFNFTVSDTNVLTCHPDGTWWELTAKFAGTTSLTITQGTLATNLDVVVTTAPPSILTLQIFPTLAESQATIQLESRVTDGFNGLSGWSVHFSIPMHRTNFIATITTDEDGYARATWTVPEDLSRSTLIVATLQRPDGVVLTSAQCIGVPFVTDALPGILISSETNINLEDINNDLLVQVHVPAEAFPEAVQPVAFLETMPAYIFPQLDDDWGFLADPVAITFIDAARAIGVEPIRPLEIVISLTNRNLSNVYVWRLVQTNGTSAWQPIDSITPGSNGLEFAIDQASVIAMVTDVRPPNVVETLPEQNAYFVSRSQPITIRFHELVTSGSALALLRMESGTNLVSIQAMVEGDRLIVTPQRSWFPGLRHRLVVPAGAVIDASGNPNNEFNLEFTTFPARRPRIYMQVAEHTNEGALLHLWFMAEPDLGYVLESTEDPYSGIWTPVWSSTIPVNTSYVETTQLIPRTISQKFYRIRVVW